MKKIESLTKEQEENLIAYREECLKIGRSCDPADRITAEFAIDRMYSILGKKTPKIVWCNGPATMVIIKSLRASLGASLQASLWASLGASLQASLVDSLWASLWASLRDSLWDSLWDSLGASLRASLVDSLVASLWDSLWASLVASLVASLGDSLVDSLGDSLRDSLNWNNWGQHELHWIAFYDWPDKNLRKMYSDSDREKLDLWLMLSKSCGWWYPYENVCLVCERPSRQAVDKEGRLHHESGPALLCRDGWPVYSWHGLRVNKDIIEHPEEITVKKINDEQNVEIRRVMLERFGEARYLKESGACVINADSYGSLYKIDIKGDEPLTMVRIENSTPEPDGTRKVFFERVPPECETAREATAWQFGKEEKDYHPDFET